VKSDTCKEATPSPEKKQRRGVSIKDVSDLKRALVRLANMMLTGKVPVDVGKATTYTLSTLLRCHEIEPEGRRKRRFVPFRLVMEADELEAMPAGERDTIMKDGGAA
jgi:hypothetical protein